VGWFQRLSNTGEGEVLALDAKVNFDDNALFKHKDIQELRDLEEEWLIVSIVAIAKPAPLTIQPISPSKAIYDKSYLELPWRRGRRN
jgi:hypothetical protein